MINYCHLPWLYCWSFTGFPVLSYLLFTRCHRGCGMESLYIWSNFLWYASLRTDLARPIRICSIFRLSIIGEIWFGPSALHEILLVSESRNAQEGERQGPARGFSTICSHPPPFIPNSRELSMLAQSCESLEVSILWPEPLPHPQLDSDVAPDCTTPVYLRDQDWDETPLEQVVFALNPDTGFSAVSLLLLHFSCLFKLMYSWWAGSWDIPALPTTGHASGVSITADTWNATFLEGKRVMQKFSSRLLHYNT